MTVPMLARMLKNAADEVRPRWQPQLDLIVHMTQQRTEHGAPRRVMMQPQRLGRSQKRYRPYREKLTLVTRRHLAETLTTADMSFMMSIALGHIAALQCMLDLGISANLRLTDAFTGEKVDLPLHTAVRFGQVEAARVLMEHGAVFERGGDTSDSSLRVAVRDWTTEMAQLLLDFGADANELDKYGHSLLHDAAANGRLSMLKVLLEYGALPEFGFKSTLADGALRARNGAECEEGGQLGMAKMLLEASADPNRTDEYSRTPLILVACGDAGQSREERSALVRLLVQHGALLEQRKHSKTPLIIAVESGSTEVVETLLDLGANFCGRALNVGAYAPRVAPALSATALHHAAACGQAAVVAILLERGARVDDVAVWAADESNNYTETGFDGCTALRDALHSAHGCATGSPRVSGLQPPPDYPEVVRLLLAAGADICTPTEKYASTHLCMTPLYEYQDGQIVKVADHWADLTSLTALEEATTQALEAYSPGATDEQKSLAFKNAGASLVLRARARSLVRIGWALDKAGRMPLDVWISHVMPGEIPSGWLAAARAGRLGR